MTQQIRPEDEIDSYKIGYLVEEAIGKLMFLQKINISEDNSSELAGFEINKLLIESVNLEKEYAKQIKERSQLGGIANRQAHKEVEERIAKTSKSLKESTKKLCRLFKENSNLEGDARKVIKEHAQLLTVLGSYTLALMNNSMETFLNEQVLNDLEDQNKLSKDLKREQELKAKIKSIVAETLRVNKDFQELLQETNKEITTQKDAYRKREASTKLSYEYKMKVNETKIATADRINNQERQNIKRAKEDVAELKARESDVFHKIKKHLEAEIDRLADEAEAWTQKKTKFKSKIIADTLEVNNQIKKDSERLDRIEKALEEEKRKEKEFEDLILKEMRANEAKSEQERQIDGRMMLIQKRFEEYLKANGGPKKKKGKKKKKK